jgi:GTPase SAR1 family protein
MIGRFLILIQIAVLGDQSSGKSSVLESLTGFSFPRGAGLCTRYVTQITCCRALETSIFVSIIPCPDWDEAHIAQLLQFQRRITDIKDDYITKIFEEVC